MCVLVAQSCLTLCDPIGCSPPGSSVHGILQMRILEWVAISSLREAQELNPGLLPFGQILYPLSHLAGLCYVSQGFSAVAVLGWQSGQSPGWLTNCQRGGNLLLSSHRWIIMKSTDRLTGEEK